MEHSSLVMGTLIEREARLQEFREAYAPPCIVDPVSASITLMRGCIYDRKGHKVEFSERRGGSFGDKLRDDNPWRLMSAPETERLEGRSFYLGTIIGSYGHFITEGISGLWPLAGKIDAGQFDHFVAHAPWGNNWQLPYQKAVWDLLGVPLEKIRLIDRPMSFDEITVCERSVIINAGWFKEAQVIYGCVSREYECGEQVRKFYLSRLGQSRRSVEFENDVADLFQRHGFEIIQPESLSFKEQMRIFTSARVIAGYAGSALHNSIFMSGGTVVELCDGRSPTRALPTQGICNEISGCESKTLAFRRPGEPLSQYLSRLEAGIVE